MADNFKIEHVLPDNYALWDEFLRQSVNGTVFQSSAYLKAVESAFQRQVQVLSVVRHQEIVGGCVLFPKQRWGFSYTTTPFLIPYNGFILGSFSQTSQERRRINYQAEVLDLLRLELERRYGFIRLDLTPGVIDFRCLLNGKWKFFPHFNIVIDLQRENNIRRNQQRGIKSFEKLDFKVKDSQDLKTFHQLVSQCYHRHGLHPPLNSQLFENFIRELLNRQLANYFIIEVDNRPVAGILIILDKNRVYALFAGKDFGRDGDDAELYLHWHLMQYFRERGVHYFDLLGGMVKSIAHFKLGLGGMLLRYDQIYYFRNSFVEMMFKALEKRKKAKRILDEPKDM